MDDQEYSSWHLSRLLLHVTNICTNFAYSFLRNPFLVGCKKRKNKTCQSRFVLAMLKQHIELVISIYYAYKAYLHISRRMLMCRDWGWDWSALCVLLQASASESQSHFRRQFLEKHKKGKKRMNARQRPVHDTIRCILLSARCKHTSSHTHKHTNTLACRAEQAGWQDKGEARVQRQSASWSAHLF